jgi:hypothetical protein
MGQAVSSNDRLSSQVFEVGDCIVCARIDIEWKESKP